MKAEGMSNLVIVIEMFIVHETSKILRELRLSCYLIIVIEFEEILNCIFIYL